MLDILKAIKLFGPSHLLKMRKAHCEGLRYTRGYFTTQCCCALLNLGFLDRIKEEKTIDLSTYAKEKNLNYKILQSICDYLYYIGVLRKNNLNYSLAKKGEAILNLSRSSYEFVYAYAPLLQELETLLKNEKIYGKDLYRRDEFVAKASFRTEQWFPIPVVKNIIRKYNFKSVLDLGCGNAAFLIDLCSQNPDLYGYGIDISQEVINNGRELITKSKLSHRIKLENLDIFQIGKIKFRDEQINAITIFFVLHELIAEGNEKAILLLKRIKETFPDSYLIVCEMSLPSPSKLKKKASLFNEYLLFHNLANQKIITPQDWRRIFKESNYRIIKEYRYNFINQDYFLLQ